MSTPNPLSIPTVQLVVSVEEANLVLTSLGQQPYYKVHALIQSLLVQVQDQLHSAQAASGDTQGVATSAEPNGAGATHDGQSAGVVRSSGRQEATP